MDNKDLFLLAVSLGLDDPTEEKEYRGCTGGWIRTEALKNADKDNALYYLITMGVADDNQVESCADLEKNYLKAQLCADSGFKKIKKIIDEENGDYEAVYSRLLSMIEMMYLTSISK